MGLGEGFSTTEQQSRNSGREGEGGGRGKEPLLLPAGSPR